MFLYFYNSVGIFKSAALKLDARDVFFSSISKITKDILPMKYCIGIAKFRGYSKRN